MQNKKVLLGFSGGIDSSRAAQILARQGYRVTALYLDMLGDNAQLENARARAEEIDIPFRSEDLRMEFSRKVVQYFTSEYMKGRTPAPCTVCNPKIKWKSLYEIAAKDDFAHIATGHYFNIESENEVLYVSAADDTVKDQSYYLWPLNQQILAKTLTPMGDQIKHKIMADRHEKNQPRESMGICFLKGENYAQFLQRETKRAIQSGNIIDKEGRIVGSHNGTPYYTIGQKRGLGLEPGECVIAIDADSNTIVCGLESDLYHRTLIISDCNIVNLAELLPADDITVKIRGIGRNPEKPCKVSIHSKGLLIELNDPAWACAAGQPVVMYRGKRVVGGGFLNEYF